MLNAGKGRPSTSIYLNYPLTLKITKMENINLSEYICTDHDNLQYCKKISWNTFEYLEFNRLEFASEFREITEEDLSIDLYLDPIYWVCDTIQLSSFSESEQLEYCSGYYSESEFIEMVKNGEYMIIAECIFEQTNELY